MKKPAETPLFGLDGRSRLQSPSPATLHQLLRAALPTQRPPAGVEFPLDVYPVNML